MNARWTTPLLIACAALLAGGCSDAAQVTYVDPNGPDNSVEAGSGGAPFERYGAAAIEHASACIDIRSALTVARTLATTDPTAASALLRDTVRDRLPVIEPRVSTVSTTIAKQLRSSIDRLASSPPADAGAYSERVHAIATTLLQPACDAAVPIEARQDQSFRAAMLAQSIEDAASSYEAAFDGSSSTVTDLAAYRHAYGLLIDASTRQLEAVPENSRAVIQEKLGQISRRSLPTPTPPDTLRDPEEVVGELSALQDDITLAARIDTTYPEPDRQTPDHLRALKRGLASAVEAAERDEGDAALTRLRTLDASALQPAAAGIASVSPDLLTELENDMLLRLPAAIRRGEDVSTLASQVDATIDEALSMVEEELDLLRESS